MFRHVFLLEFASAIATVHHGLLAFGHVLFRVALADNPIALCAQVVHHENDCVKEREP